MTLYFSRGQGFAWEQKELGDPHTEKQLLNSLLVWLPSPF